RSVIQGIRRVSRPSIRRYSGYRDLKPVRSGFGIQIMSTPKGIMTGRDAKKQKLGGEVICEVW
ncbi:MAG: uS8 family ribosomal protein, partial [Candidatus Hydrogenedens sp.]